MEVNNDQNDNTQKYLDITKIIKRDLTSSNQIGKYKTYQIQAEKNSKYAKLVYLGKFNHLPLQNILTFNHPRYSDIKCQLVSYTITKNEINNFSEFNENKQYLKILGFLICIDEKIIASCDYVFYPLKTISLEKKINHNKNTNNKIMENGTTVNKKTNEIEGSFKIILFQKEKLTYKSTIIKEYPEYIGKEESIYNLTQVLLEENVIEKYIKKK